MSEADSNEVQEMIVCWYHHPIAGPSREDAEILAWMDGAGREAIAAARCSTGKPLDSSEVRELFAKNSPPSPSA